MHALDHAPGTLGLLGNALQAGVQVAAVGRGQRRRAGRLQQIERAVGIAGDGRQRLVEFMADQRRHLAHCRQARRGLQALLRQARRRLDAALLADVDESAHPAGLHALGVEQRGLIDHHRKARAVLALELRLIALARGGRALRGQLGVVLQILLEAIRRPVDGRRAAAQQFLLVVAHHGAERRVDVGDAPLQVAHAQAGDLRILHRLAQRQRLAQLALGVQAPAVVAHQHDDDRHQRNRHHGHQRGEHVGVDAGRLVPAVHAQHQRDAGQAQQLLRGEGARASALRGDDGQARAVHFGERQLARLLEAALDQLGQHGLQRVDGDHIALDAAVLDLGQAHRQQFLAQAARHGLEVAVGIRRRLLAQCIGAGKGNGAGSLGGRRRIRAALRCAVGRLDLHVQLELRVAPGDAHQLAAQLQQVGRAHLPLQRVGCMRLQRLQALQVVAQRRAHVGGGIGVVALDAVLHRRCLVAPGQPQLQNQHGHHQHHQRRPQQPALQVHDAPAQLQRQALQQLRAGLAPATHGATPSTRWRSAGRLARTCARRVRCNSPITTPAPWACSASTSPQGSTSMLWPQV